MINTLCGKVIALYEQSVILEIAGVGFELFLPSVSNIQHNQNITLHTYLHWNQEHGPSLYGFLTSNEKTIFLLVIKCPGVGPKLALSILQHCPIASFVKAVQNNDVSALHEIPGIGRKKAEQLVLELKDKINKLLENGFSAVDEHVHWKELSQVLTSLNYSKTEIAMAFELIRNESLEQVTFDHLLRKSLSYLAKRK